MRVLKIIICFSLLFISCKEENKQENTAFVVDEILIPSIEKDKNDVSFNLKNGILFFDKIPFSGIVKDFYSEGALKSTSEYYKGKRQGTYIGMYKNGNLWFQRFYSQGLKIGIHKGWQENGNLMFEYYFNEEGQYNGSVKDWHKNGILGKHFNYKNGEEVESQKMWDLNGKIRANFYTVNGERHGLIGLKKCVSVLTNKNDEI